MHRRDRIKHALDAVRAAVMHEARALHLDEGARPRQAGHEFGDGGEPRQRGPGVRAAEAPGLAGVDSVELARHHHAHVAAGARRAFEGRVVDHEGHAVRGELHVELDVRNPVPPGRLERGQRVLRKVFRIAPVCDDRWQHAPNYSRAVDSRRARSQRPAAARSPGGSGPGARTRSQHTRITSHASPRARTRARLAPRSTGLHDTEAWSRAERLATPEAWQRYLGEFPDGRHAAGARQRLIDFIPPGPQPADGRYVVQLGAYSTEAAARADLARAAAAHARHPRGHRASRHRAADAADSIWRLRTGALVEAPARDLCARLRAGGVDCVPLPDDSAGDPPP